MGLGDNGMYSALMQAGLDVVSRLQDRGIGYDPTVPQCQAIATSQLFLRRSISDALGQ